MTEASARGRKADRLVGAALQTGASAELVATDPELREQLVATAGVREPSLLTWQLVVRRLVEAERQPTWAERIAADIEATHARIQAGEEQAGPGPKFLVLGGRT